MPVKKKPGAKKKKASKGDAVPKAPAKEYVHVDVCNATWKSMRLTLQLTTSERIATVVAALQNFHGVGVKGLRLYVGDAIVEETLIDTGANPTLKELGIVGGSQLFDAFRASITYDYPPFRSVLNLPVHTSLI
ncbi:hypothetical protein KFE25_006916 [Diacronema lutheri]|uniref:Uncharacterized protein n=1 Tax=Diacronema lutheri TaxID=2081491 RepID=A0A8J5XPT5_DIALT|nr:hypothetical protein KFE25_006916 [Diacronema lutheri]